MRRYTPYNYAYNNPINFIDPDGMEGKPVNDKPVSLKNGYIKVQISPMSDPVYRSVFNALKNTGKLTDEQAHQIASNFSKANEDERILTGKSVAATGKTNYKETNIERKSTFTTVKTIKSTTVTVEIEAMASNLKPIGSGAGQVVLSDTRGTGSETSTTGEGGVDVSFDVGITEISVGGKISHTVSKSENRGSGSSTSPTVIEYNGQVTLNVRASIEETTQTITNTSHISPMHIPMSDTKTSSQTKNTYSYDISTYKDIPITAFKMGTLPKTKKK